MFYFLALNLRSIGNDISIYPVTFSHTFRLDKAELTLRAVIK